MKHVATVTSVLFLLLLTMVVPADAQDRGAGRRGMSREAMLEQFDADGDGQLSEEERAKAREAMKPLPGPYPLTGKEQLEKFDTDGDGELSAAEKRAARETLGKEHRKISAVSCLV